VAFLAAFVAIDHAQNSAQSNSVRDLGGKSWALVRFQGSDGKALVPDDRSKYAIAFEPDGNVSVRIDCNRGRGTWKSSGPNQISFGPLALTRAMCPPAPLNDRMARDWEYVRSYTLRNGQLFLSLMADGGTYEFGPSGTGIAGQTGLPATFVGTLPCADCPGIRYQVNLLRDQHFDSRMIYLERNASFDDHGSWQIENDGKIIVLQSQRGSRQQYALRNEDTLRQLDTNGHEIDSKLNYDLTRSPVFTPIESHGQQANAVALENTDWALIGLGDNPIHAASKEQAPHLLLTSESHRVSGSTGCNQMMGSYELSGNHLTFGQLASTLMACAKGMDTEKAFQDALAKVSTWKITGSHLELLDASGHLLARFKVR
jgi:heat shock protein HslJ